MPDVPYGEERFLSAYVQRSRECGEQILVAGWRLPAGTIEAFVFLLDWRGDGLKDFYRTRSLSDAEWRVLVDHNSSKGAPLVEISLGQAIALVQAALAVGRRFGRPLQREFRLENRVVERRMPAAWGAADTAPHAALIGADLAPAAVVEAYVAALHHRDYTLAAGLLAESHPLRAARPLEEVVATLWTAYRYAPRREELVRVEPTAGALRSTRAAAAVALTAFGTQVATEPGGRRVRSAVVERFDLVRVATDWRIAQIGMLA